MFRRRPSAPVPAFPRVEWVPMSLAELKVYEHVVLDAERLKARRRPDIGFSGYRIEEIGRLYQRVGAASVHVQDQTRVRIPLQKSEIQDLEMSVKDLEFYRGDVVLIAMGRQLLWRLQALLGRERAVVHAGGTPMFDSDNPAAVVVDNDEMPLPSFPALPAPGR